MYAAVVKLNALTNTVRTSGKNHDAWLFCLNVLCGIALLVRDVVVLRGCTKLTCAGIYCLDLWANTQHFPHSTDNVCLGTSKVCELLIREAQLFGSKHVIGGEARKSQLLDAFLGVDDACHTMQVPWINTGHIVDALNAPISAQCYETVMVNCNPETVSTDYDTSDRLYFEPLTFEDVMNVIDSEKPVGVIVTLGGQTPINLAGRLREAGVPIMGTQPDAIDLAEDRDRFSVLLDRLSIAYPPSSTAETLDEAREVARAVGYPLLVRPSYVLGGRGMAIVYGEEELATYMAEATQVSPDHPVYLDAFLEDAIELDVDALADGTECYVGSVLEHIEECGIHSGDSACCYPPFSLSDAIVGRVREITRRLALAVGVRGPLNIQYAVKDEQVLVIEMNPRASRTVPFSSKATGVPLASFASRIMAGETIASLRDSGELPEEGRDVGRFAVKEAVMPWSRFPGADSVLGPEMKSTGEVMGIDATFPVAYAKTRQAIDYKLPRAGRVFVSVCDRDKRAIAPVAMALVGLGYQLVATAGTAKTLRAAGLACEVTKRLSEGHPNIVDEIEGGDIAFIINTPQGNGARGDGSILRSEAVNRGITCVTALSATTALVQAIAAVRDTTLDVYALQDLP